MPDLAKRTTGSSTRWLHALAVAGILAAVARIFAQSRHYALLGWDTYPLILASRILAPGDLASTFSERLMSDALGSDYYRPLLDLSVALDYAISGLSPLGYQITGALLFGAGAAALYALCLELSGGAVAAIAALALYLIHPAHFEVVPVPSRRPELLCLLFAALALFAQARVRVGARVAWLPALLGLLAMASKETGFVAVPLAAGVAFTAPDARGIRQRSAHTARQMAPWALVVLGLIVVRFAVLGGLVGRTTDYALGLAQIPASVLRLARASLIERPDLLEPAAAFAPLAGALICLAIARGAAAAPREDDTGTLRAGGVGLAAFLLVAGVYAAAGLIQPWYVTVPLAGVVLVVGAVVQGLWGAWRTSRGVARAAAAVGLGLSLALGAQWAWLSPLFRHYDQWEEATRAANRYLAGLREVVDDTANGETRRHSGPRLWIRGRGDGPKLQGASVLHAYSVQAWATLVFPDRRVRVEEASSAPAPVGADEVLIVLHYGARPE